MRVAANSEQTANWAGRQGLPIMFATNVNPLPLIPKLLAAYQEGRAQAGHAASTPQDLSLLMPTFVHDDPEHVRALMQPSIEYFVRLAMSVTQAGLERCTTAEERQPLALLQERVRSLTYEVVESKMGVLGTPDSCIAKLKALRSELGMGRVITWFNFGGLVPHLEAMRSMELFSNQVMPHFQRET
jgi:alkanesulfonate monooxygenase SsuD/methylene tetrahydromethanopterin reductase-like flavin-dependent oxidoreductase (luciferase family)